MGPSRTNGTNGAQSNEKKKNFEILLEWGWGTGPQYYSYPLNTYSEYI